MFFFCVCVFGMHEDNDVHIVIQDLNRMLLAHRWGCDLPIPANKKQVSCGRAWSSKAPTKKEITPANSKFSHEISDDFFFFFKKIYIYIHYIPIIAGKYPHGCIPPCVFRQAPPAPANGGALKAMDLRAATHLTQVGMAGIDGHQAKYGNGKSFANVFYIMGKNGHTYLYIYMHIHVYNIFINVCIYIYTYINICIIYIYIYIFVCCIFLYMNGGFSIAMFDYGRVGFTLDFWCPILRQSHRNTENKKCWVESNLKII